jgi:hypothetical protein
MSMSGDVELAREGRVLTGGYQPDVGGDERGLFAVYYVYEPDGDVDRDSTHHSLRAALVERDLRQKQFEEKAKKNGRRATGFFGVLDESGARDGRWLDWNDLP